MDVRYIYRHCIIAYYKKLCSGYPEFENSTPRGSCSIIASEIMAGVASKTVLVEFQDHSRVVSFNSEGSNNELESLKNNIENVFQDVFSTPPAPFFLKLFNKEWERCMDVRAGQSIPDKGVIRVYLLKESKVGELK